MSMELNKESVEQAGGDERAAFEVWASALGWKLSPDQNNCGIVVAERYGHPGVQRCWEAWQARAALAQAEAERPEVVAFIDTATDNKVHFHATAWDQRHRLNGAELMTVAQHDRIVGALRAENANLIEALDECDGDRWKLRSERDAALARVAELEGKLTDWVHEGFRLNEAIAVAKAQHSVPDDDMILQIFADNAEHSEQGDEHGYCIVREQHAQAIARKLLAAAPGKEGV
ncbi:TPA: hypothetical protein ACHFUW_002660 [Pseudomonas aeruginosa]